MRNGGKAYENIAPRFIAGACCNLSATFGDAHLAELLPRCLAYLKACPRDRCSPFPAAGFRPNGNWDERIARAGRAKKTAELNRSPEPREIESTPVHRATLFSFRGRCAEASWNPSWARLRDVLEEDRVFRRNLDLFRGPFCSRLTLRLQFHARRELVRERYFSLEIVCGVGWLTG